MTGSIRLLLFAFLALSPSAAGAHAILVESNPASDARVPAGNVVMLFRFNSRIDHARSRLTLARPNQSPAVLPIAANSTPDTLRASADLTPGSYVVRWQVLATDGHITRGEVPFAVLGHPATAMGDH